MKKFIILFLTVGFFITCKAQVREPLRQISQTEHHQPSYDSKIGDYIMDTTNNLDIYEGTWIYNDNQGTVFTLKLQRKNQVLNDIGNSYYFYDQIILTYRLEKNNVVLFDNLDSTLPNEIVEDEGFGYLGNSANFNDLDGSFIDVAYNMSSSCTIKKLNTPSGQPEKISFRLYGSRKRNPPSFYVGLPTFFSVPNNIELTKF